MFLARQLSSPGRLYCVKCAQCFSSQSFDFKTSVAKNEPMFDYAPKSKEQEALNLAIHKYSKQVTEIPIVVGEEEIKTSEVRYQVCPFDHQKKIAKYYYADSDIIEKAIYVSQEARTAWGKRPLAERAEIFARAADIISTDRRMDLLATTMLGQAKNVVQAEIDTAAELADFYRFNNQFAKEITEYQPICPSETETNTMVYRGMEGFWAAITPFNFTAIGGHLPAAPALMGNVVLWKPSDTAMLSNYTVFKILQEAGLPPGVINFLPADGPLFGNTVTSSSYLSGINFTGSVRTFKTLWKLVAENMDIYRTYPRIIGECGGKNMHFVHSSADAESVINGSIRSAFEYGGQKCSACSRMYVPESLWPKIKDGLIAIQKQVKLGSALEQDTFLSAVIDQKAFHRIKSYIDHAKSCPDETILAGGGCDDRYHYTKLFYEPTIIQTTNPLGEIMQEEIFGPVLTVYVYPDNKCHETAHLAANTSSFGLTAAIFVQDQYVYIPFRFDSRFV
ncbi:hypothetical protein ScPMuIL_009052 [Solemya velum]